MAIKEKTEKSKKKETNVDKNGGKREGTNK
jgi:hypothetical protein